MYVCMYVDIEWYVCVSLCQVFVNFEIIGHRRRELRHGVRILQPAAGQGQHGFRGSRRVNSAWLSHCYAYETI